jgi:L-asparaginase II
VTARSLSAEGSVELAVVERNGLIESRHLGAAVVVGPSGKSIRELGDVRATVYPRSSVKMLQAIAVLRAGVELDGARLAIAAASHAGTPKHLELVRSLLDEAGLEESALQCPEDWPLDDDARDDVVRSGGVASRILMNCSGKHAAFLLASVHNGWSTASYLDPTHPMQRLVVRTVEDFSGERVEQVGVDGCGAPLVALSLTGLARSVSRLMMGNDTESELLVSAILDNAWALDGTRRPNTIMIEQLGVVAKGGAEGVLVVATRSGVAVAIKMLDGGSRALPAVALRLLADAGEIDEADAELVTSLTTEPILGGGIPVGSIRATL